MLIPRASASARPEQCVAIVQAFANVALIVAGTGSALVLCYFLYRYGWSHERQIADWTGVLIYYAAPALSALFLFAGLRLKPDHRIGLVIAGLSLTLSACGGELVLRLLEPAILRNRWPAMVMLKESPDRKKMAAMLARRFGVSIDARDTTEVLGDLHRNGVDAVPSVFPRYQLRHYKKEGIRIPPIIALGGISNRTTVLCNESGQFVTYESDEHGFRNAKELWASAHIEVAALGDSFTQGYCVPSDKDFVGIVKQRYPSTLNLGMAGAGPLLMLATLKEYVVPLTPRLVLWFYFEGNDLVDLQDERESTVLMRYLEEGFTQRLSQRQDEIDRALAAFVEKERASENTRREESERNRSGIGGELVNFLLLPELRRRLRLIHGTDTQGEQVASDLKVTAIALFQKILLEARRNVESWGGTLYFVYLPNWTRYDPYRPSSSDSRAAEARREDVLAVARDLQLSIIDLLPAFDAQRDPMSLFPFHAPGHYTEDGHRLVAEMVLNGIAARTSTLTE